MSNSTDRPIPTLIAAAVTAAAGKLAFNIDLDDVRRIGPGVVAVGDPSYDGCVTINSDDKVTVWVAGEEAAVSTLVGAYEHYVLRVRS